MLVFGWFRLQCCGGFLRYSPITRGGIQIRVDRTRLNVVDRNPRLPTSLESA